MKNIKKYAIRFGILFGILLIAFIAMNAKIWMLEAQFKWTSYVMNTRIVAAHAAIDSANESISNHDKSICAIATHKLKKLAPETDEKLKTKVFNTCEVIPPFIERGWGFEFVENLPAHDNTTRDNPPL